MPCSTMDIFLGLPFDGKQDNGESYVKMYVKSTVKVKKTVLDYTWLSMLAEIGGYTGLLLGVSVVNVTGPIDKFLHKFWGSGQSDRRVGKQGKRKKSEGKEEEGVK